MPAGALAASITAGHARVVSAQAELIARIAAFDAREAWKADGARSMANWLVASLHVSFVTASEWVALGRALPGLPALASSLASGELPVESAAAAAQLVVGDPAGAVSDDQVTAEAKALPADALHKAVRRQEQAAAQAPGQRPRPKLSWWHSEDGWTQFRGWLPPEEGAVVIAAVERAESDEVDPVTGEFDPPEVAAAEALVALASTALREDDDPDRACVVVHVPVEALVSGEGTGELASGGAVPASVVRRLACDGRIEAVAISREGLAGRGAARQQIPHSLSRYLKHRDGTCQFPGCGMRRHLHAHHIVHWANGGPTKAVNLVMLCSRHHKLMHEGGWSAVGNPEPGPGANTSLRFLRPDGAPFDPCRQKPTDMAGMDLLTALRMRR